MFGEGSQVVMISGASEATGKNLALAAKLRPGKTSPRSASGANNGHEFARGFDDFSFAACLQRGRVDQFASDSNCESSGREVFGGIPCIHTACRDQSGARKRPAQCLDVFGASDTSARKNLDSRSALVKRGNQFGGRERARNC